MRVNLSADERFLEADFGAPQRTLSWAVVGGGFGHHARVVWHFVGRAELPEDVDAVQLLRTRLKHAGYEGAVGMMTARRLGPYEQASARHGDLEARSIVTVGLGNALRVGDAPGYVERVGTINVLAHVDVPLSDAALIEALAIATEARTLAVLEAGYRSIVSERAATGTGTDCIVVACGTQGRAREYSGKHTDVGAALGASVLEATRRATRAWLNKQTREGDAT